MKVPYAAIQNAFVSEGHTEKEPFHFYYYGSDDEYIFLYPPDEDGYMDTVHVLSDIAVYDRRLASSLRNRLARDLNEPPENL